MKSFWDLVLASCLYLMADAHSHAQFGCRFLGVHEVRHHAMHVSRKSHLCLPGHGKQISHTTLWSHFTC